MPFATVFAPHMHAPVSIFSRSGTMNHDGCVGIQEINFIIARDIRPGGCAAARDCCKLLGFTANAILIDGDQAVGNHTVCLAGGTHHAFKGRGEAFCVFNDVAIAVRDLQEKRPGIRIMIVDTDAHQGTGTNSILQNDPRVFTYSIHVGQTANTATDVEGSMDVETVRYVEGDTVPFDLIRERINRYPGQTFVYDGEAGAPAQ